jgi:D-xylose transport system ATP-binding protein
MEGESRRLLDSLAVRTLKSVRTEVGMLSGGQRQTVAIARSMLGEPRLVILDEPTAALGIAQTEQVLNLVARLKQRGLGVILISHNLADVFQVADRIVVLRLGRNGGEYAATDDQRQHVVAAITGATANDAQKEVSS